MLEPLDQIGKGRGIVVADADIVDSKVAILKNADGKGGSWTKAELPRSFTYGSLHALAVADFNGDGALDLAAIYDLKASAEDQRIANVDGTRTILQAALDTGISRTVYTSSVGTLGNPGDGTPGTEDTPVSLKDMVGHYKRSKFLAEQVALDFARQGLPLVVVESLACGCRVVMTDLPGVDAWRGYRMVPGKAIPALASAFAAVPGALVGAVPPFVQTASVAAVLVLGGLKVMSGALKNDSQLQNFNRNTIERLQHVLVMQGKTSSEVPQLHAGDLGAVFMVLDARIRLVGAHGERVVSATSFFASRRCARASSTSARRTSCSSTATWAWAWARRARSPLESISAMTSPLRILK